MVHGAGDPTKTRGKDHGIMEFPKIQQVSLEAVYNQLELLLSGETTCCILDAHPANLSNSKRGMPWNYQIQSIKLLHGHNTLAIERPAPNKLVPPVRAHSRGN